MARPRLEGNVYRRQDSPTWWLWYWDSRGKRRAQACRSTDEGSARAELAAVLERVRRGQDPVVESAGLTLTAWGHRWLDLRAEAGKDDVDARAHLEHHIAPELGRIRLENLTAVQVLDFVRRLPSRRVATGTGERLSPRTVHKIAGTLRLCLREAAKRGLIQASPYNCDRSDLPEPGQPAVGEGFAETEVLQLVTDLRIAEDRRMLYALEFLTGMRTGEAAARAWRDWDRSRAPLGALKVETAWSSRRRVVKDTKTRVRRLVPVHQVLAQLLERWQAEGWQRFVGRAPGPEDLIVPAPGGGTRDASTSWRLFQEDLELLGLEAQRHYETRSTFLSLAEAGGADVATLRLLTHPSPKTAADLYRRMRLLWPRLCDAVAVIRVALPAAPAAA